MQNNIGIDWGNTRVKVGVFNGTQLVADYNYNHEEAEAQIATLLILHKVEKSILCSVAYHGETLEALLQNNTNFLKFTTTTNLPFLNAYASPESLGLDRLALVAAAFDQAPHNNNLIISVGTAVTYNLVLANRAFRGGNITPGLVMRLQAMHAFTENLPMLNYSNEDVLLGYDTESSMRSGAKNGLLFEMEGFIDAYQKQFGSLNVWLTGGDGSVFANKLKNVTFADSKLLLRGLNSILLYNVK